MATNGPLASGGDTWNIHDQIEQLHGLINLSFILVEFSISNAQHVHAINLLHLLEEVSDHDQTLSI
uniref:Uncharacterized protein n=1 Tax=Strigamia maritima TaxID=126957 RepID=T1IY54_STRMM